jgi:hypothetical protein
MFDYEHKEISTRYVVEGFFMGLLLSGGCFAAAFLLGGLAGRSVWPNLGIWLFPLLIALCLTATGWLVWKFTDNPGRRRGMIVGLALVFLLNAACGYLIVR